MTAVITKVTATVIQDPDDPEQFCLDLGTELCEQLGWYPGDEIVWTNNDDGSWTLHKPTK